MSASPFLTNIFKPAFQVHFRTGANKLLNITKIIPLKIDHIFKDLQKNKGFCLKKRKLNRVDKGSLNSSGFTPPGIRIADQIG
jgi:hypothetical protein